MSSFEVSEKNCPCWADLMPVKVKVKVKFTYTAHLGVICSIIHTIFKYEIDSDFVYR